MVTRKILPMLVGLLLIPCIASATVSSPHAIGAFRSSNDGYNHVIIGVGQTAIREIFYLTPPEYPPYGFVSGSVVYNFPSGASITAVDGWYTPNDTYKHAVVGYYYLGNYYVAEVYWGPFGISAGTLANFGSSYIQDVTGWWDGSSSWVAVALSNGQIWRDRFAEGVWHNIYTWPSYQYPIDITGYHSGTKDHIVMAVANGGDDLYDYIPQLSGFSYVQDTSQCGVQSVGGLSVYATPYGPDNSASYYAPSTTTFSCTNMFNAPTTTGQTVYAPGVLDYWDFGRTIRGVAGFQTSVSGTAINHHTQAVQNSANGNDDIYDIYDQNGSSKTAFYLGSF